jgi:hypothetical protein
VKTDERLMSLNFYGKMSVLGQFRDFLYGSKGCPLLEGRKIPLNLKESLQNPLAGSSPFLVTVTTSRQHIKKMKNII